ncbi:murein L,D-transpeptidase catalytic domain family protein [Mucilaginibacter sp.]
MRKHFWWITCVVLLVSITIISWKPVSATNKATAKPAPASAKELFQQYVDAVYQAANLQASGLDEAVFKKAVTGFMNLKSAQKISPFSSVLTVVDFNKSSRQKRMWIVDLVEKQLLINTWVAHGQGSGDEIANSFSNTDESHQSSLGFYLADDVYVGKHGRSLRLDGLDAGFNDAARAREIVVHAAPYVSQSTINQLGRLGRSWGCPAVSPEVSDEVINTIKGKTVFFINGNDSNYSSKYLDEDLSANYVFPAGNDGNKIANL